MPLIEGMEVMLLVIREVIMIKDSVILVMLVFKNRNFVRVGMLEFSDFFLVRYSVSNVLFNTTYILSI